MQIKISGEVFPLLSATAEMETLNGCRRDVITMEIETTYAKAISKFIDGASFSIADGSLNEEQEFLYEEHTVAGPITDNRNGTVTVKMGKKNTAEQDAIQARQKAESIAEILGGRPVGALKDASALRAVIETAVVSLDDETAATVPSLFTPWTVGEAVSVGDRRYYAPKLYKVVQAHTTQADWTPDVTPALWAVVGDPGQAGTIDDPITAARGMEYEYGLYYFDPEDGKVYLCQREGEEPGGKIVLQYLPHELVDQYFTDTTEPEPEVTA